MKQNNTKNRSERKEKRPNQDVRNLEFGTDFLDEVPNTNGQEQNKTQRNNPNKSFR